MWLGKVLLDGGVGQHGCAGRGENGLPAARGAAVALGLGMVRWSVRLEREEDGMVA